MRDATASVREQPIRLRPFRIGISDQTIDDGNRQPRHARGHDTMASDIEIARAATMKPITEIGARLDIPAATAEQLRQGMGRLGAQRVVAVDEVATWLGVWI